MICKVVVKSGNVLLNSKRVFKFFQRLTQRAVDAGDSARFQAVHYASALFRLDGVPPSAPAPLTQAVETVEKVLSDSRKTSRFGILQVSTESRGAYAAVQSL